MVSLLPLTLPTLGQCTQRNLELRKYAETTVFTSFYGLDKTEITNSKGTTSDGIWLVQGNVVMLVMFYAMFEIFKHMVL